MIEHAMKSDLVEVSVQLRHTTERAVLIFDGAAEVWLPISQIEVTPADPITGMTIITLPEWLAQEKGLI